MEVAQLTPVEFDRFRDVIYARSGIRIGDRKLSLLSNRIRRRLRACGFDDFDSYYRYLTSAGSHELEYFLDAITTNETSFFRTGTHFEWLNETFLPEVIAAHRRGEHEQTLRFWSAACASGAEPYSIAILLAENRFRLSGWSWEVLGTDISEEELKKAAEGVFKARVMETVSDQRRRRYFTSLPDERWQVKPAVRDRVRFVPHNLMMPAPECGFDGVFLCNVLIYFDDVSKRRVLTHVIEAIAPGGYLVTGPSEGVFGLLNEMKRHSSCVYQKV